MGKNCSCFFFFFFSCHTKKNELFSFCFLRRLFFFCFFPSLEARTGVVLLVLERREERTGEKEREKEKIAGLIFFFFLSSKVEFSFYKLLFSPPTSFFQKRGRQRSAPLCER